MRNNGKRKQSHSHRASIFQQLPPSCSSIGVVRKPIPPEDSHSPQTKPRSTTPAQHILYTHTHAPPETATPATRRYISRRMRVLSRSLFLRIWFAGDRVAVLSHNIKFSLIHSNSSHCFQRFETISDHFSAEFFPIGSPNIPTHSYKFFDDFDHFLAVKSDFPTTETSFFFRFQQHFYIFANFRLQKSDLTRCLSEVIFLLPKLQEIQTLWSLQNR